MQILSKLPQVEASIFSVMSGLARQHQAINLSQGFPNFDCDPVLKDLVNKYMQAGQNQYAPMGGIPALTTALSKKINRLYQVEYDAATEITTTTGATQALSTAIMALVEAGDEVIIVEPAYDSYRPFIELCGAKAVAYELAPPDWKIDWDQFKSLITNKTKMILLNTPHNPSGICLDADDFKQLAKLVEGTNIIILSDEVYEHMVFDGKRHQSILEHEVLRSRSLATYSFGKTLHATGWKLGYIVGDAKLMQEFRKVHQFNVFSVNTPMQYAIAEYLEVAERYESLSPFFEQKRDLFLDLIKDSRFKIIPSQGTYFQLLDYSQISSEDDVTFAKRMTIEKGIALIPVSVFYQSKQQHQVVRACFAKTDETLREAAVLLNKI